MKPVPISIPNEILAAVSDRFFLHVEVSERGCWLWRGCQKKRGSVAYGLFALLRRTLLAHRVSYQLHKGDIPDGLIVRHACDNGLCVRPDHLILGTDMDNAHDRDSRGRSGTVGVKNAKAKLTEDQVREIRKRFTGEWGQVSQLMREFGIKAPAFYAIVRRTGWRHVKD